MGAWGHGNLENDTVLDWIEELLETQGLDLLTESIETVLEDNDVDADTACIALGAIEILAALQNRQPSKEIYENEELVDWINQHLGLGANLLEKSQIAIGKILTDSELKDLWEETEDYQAWVNTIKELEGRLRV